MPSVHLLSYKRPLRVGISGAGPGGLGAALFLNQINDIVGSGDGKKEVEIQLFDQAKELREVGAVSCRFVLPLALLTSAESKSEGLSPP